MVKSIIYQYFTNQIRRKQKMKKASILIFIAVVAITSMAKAGVPDYVICNNDVRYYEKVRFGLTSSLVGLDQNERVRYNANEVVAYRKGGRVFERVPVIRDNSETGRYKFMELVTYRNGLKVYRDQLEGSLMQPEYDYYVFQDGKYVVKFDEKNSQTLNSFFFGSNPTASKK
jgi:hypothetical protein